MTLPVTQSTTVPSLSSLLNSLTDSLQSTITSIPAAPSYVPPRNGISLLDLKNELMLTYLHNLVFLLLVRIRSGKASENGEDISRCVNKLVQAKTWLEKGIRPVESELRYQIEKVARRSLEAETIAAGRLPKKGNDESSEEESEVDDDDEDEDTKANGAALRSPNVNYDDIEEGVTTISSSKASTSILSTNVTLTDDVSFRPNPSAIITKQPLPSTTASNDGIYRPPRISATMMPTTDLPTTDTGPKPSRLSKKSHTLDDFIASELSTAPIPEPSIGTTIHDGGRHNKTARDRREEQERREYEEANFVRLPGLSKKERRQRRERDRAVSGDMFGGEDWRGFAGDLDRLTARATEARSGAAVALERSRKRKEVGEEGGSKAARIGRQYSRMVGREGKRRKKE